MQRKLSNQELFRRCPYVHPSILISVGLTQGLLLTHIDAYILIRGEKIPRQASKRWMKISLCRDNLSVRFSLATYNLLLLLQGSFSSSFYEQLLCQLQFDAQLKAYNIKVGRNFLLCVLAKLGTVLLNESFAQTIPTSKGW